MKQIDPIDLPIVEFDIWLEKNMGKDIFEAMMLECAKNGK